MPPAEQGIPEQGQQPVYHQEHDEQSVALSPPDMEMVVSLSQERHLTYQQGNDGLVNSLTYHIATDGRASEASCPIPEADEIEGHGLNACERQPGYQQSEIGRSNDLNHSLLNGHRGEAVSREESSIQESFACQLVNGQQQQPRYQQSTQANALSYPTQEMGVDASQRQERQQLRNSIEETAPFAERTPGEHEDLPPCYRHLNGADINEVSSTGEREHAVEHTCSRQELQLWRQESDRQADVMSTAFLAEMNLIQCHLCCILYDWSQQSLIFNYIILN